MIELQELLSDEDDDSETVSHNRKNKPPYKGGTVEHGHHKWMFTVEEAVEKIGFGKFQMKLFFICGMFSASDAMEMLLLAVLSPSLRCDWKLREWEVAMITTCVFIGMGIMAPIWGKFCDLYGRWPILLLTAIWISYSGLLSSFSPTLMWILILRGCVGAGIGGASQAFTLFVEYIPSKYRAKTLVIHQIFWAIGSAFEISLAMIIIPRYGWRKLAIVSAIPLGISVLFFKWLPESARYLTSKGRGKEAMKELKNAGKLNNSPLPNGRLYVNKTKPGSYIEMFSNGFCRTTLQLWIIWFSTAFTYYGIILAGSEILEFPRQCGSTNDTLGAVAHVTNTDCKCNLLKHKDYLSMIFSTFGEFTAIPFNWLLLDLIGRKKTLALGLFGAGSCILLVQLCTSTTALTVFLFGVRGFSSSIFNSIYLYTAEVYPTTIRSLALGSCSAWARVGAMTTPFVAQVLLEQSLFAAVWVYGGVCLLGFLSAICLPIETKGREMMQHVAVTSPAK